VSNSVLWYTTRGAGGVTLILLTVVVVLGMLSALRAQSPNWPQFLTAGLHRNLALMTLVFLALHITTAVIDPFTNLGWMAALVPFTSSYRTFWLGLGVIAFELLVAVVVTSLLRTVIGLRAWRAVHWVTYGSWPIAVIHGFGTGTDSWSAWLIAITIVCAAAVGAAALYRLMAGSTDPLAASRTDFRAAVQKRELP
jgi:predicted ferric reductase